MKRKLNLGKELSKAQMKQVTGGSTVQTYCTNWPPPGATPIGCQPAYCGGFHGSFLYCA